MHHTLKTTMILLAHLLSQGLFKIPFLTQEAWAQPAGQTILLSGDFLAMASVRHSAQSFLYAISYKNSQKYLEIFGKATNGSLQRVQMNPLPPDVTGFDICQDPQDPKKEEMLLIGHAGIYRIHQSQPFLRRETILAHPRDDTMVRVKLCFNLFKGEERSLVIPRIHGVDVFRINRKGEYSHDSHFPVRAEARYQWPILRGAHASVQRVAVRFEYPDVNALDFNGDGFTDLCFSSSESVRCVFQDGFKGFINSIKPLEFYTRALTSEEKKDTSKRVETKLIDINGDHKPELVVAKSTWNISDIGVSLSFFKQDPQELFQRKPFQTIQRSGYFGFQEYWDYDGDGLIDMTAPVATTTWTDIAAAYLTKKVQLEFVLYKNIGGKFDEKPIPLHSMNYPIDFKNWASLLGCLPIWNSNLGQKEKGVLFFPMAQSIELRTINKELGINEKITWETPAEIGGDVQTIDLDQDSKNEIVIGYPKDPHKSNRMIFFNTPHLNPS